MFVWATLQEPRCHSRHAAFLGYIIDDILTVVCRTWYEKGLARGEGEWDGDEASVATYR